jgi:hypothetical protein
MYPIARLACQAERLPGRKMLCEGGALMPIASDSPPRSVEASLKQHQAISRFDSKNAIARITRCPARTEVELRPEFTRGGVIEARVLSTICMSIAGNKVQKAFSFLIRVLLLL